jgi:hypothetical protein
MSGITSDPNDPRLRRGVDDAPVEQNDTGQDRAGFKGHPRLAASFLGLGDTCTREPCNKP